jgi:hypothetical protein
VDAALAAKCLPVSVGIPEAILSQRFGHVHIANRREHESKNSCPILLDDALEIFNIQCRVFPCSSQRTRLWQWASYLV